MIPNDTPGPVEGGCAREGCGHSASDHYTIKADYAPPGVAVPMAACVNVGRGPCNVRGHWTHCICYEYLPDRRARVAALFEDQTSPLIDEIAAGLPAGRRKDDAR